MVTLSSHRSGSKEPAVRRRCGTRVGMFSAEAAARWMVGEGKRRDKYLAVWPMFAAPINDSRAHYRHTILCGKCVELSRCVVLPHLDNSEQRLPSIPNGVRVTYPMVGKALLLPLSPDNEYQPEILICGGSTIDDTKPSYEISSQDAVSKQCSSLLLTEAGIAKGWETEDMPDVRLMLDAVLLPTGQVILNSAGSGISSYGNVLNQVGASNADNPVLTPILYTPSAPHSSCFSSARMPTSKIPRMYHSVATLSPGVQMHWLDEKREAKNITQPLLELWTDSSRFRYKYAVELGSGQLDKIGKAANSNEPRVRRNSGTRWPPARLVCQFCDKVAPIAGELFSEEATDEKGNELKTHLPRREVGFLAEDLKDVTCSSLGKGWRAKTLADQAVGIGVQPLPGLAEFSTAQDVVTIKLDVVLRYDTSHRPSFFGSFSWRPSVYSL
ncbi:hypothetical protein B0H14DRAFT_3543876 [Mycena olivaceomarginata]|nr:hypothetical protein B0H14DRAFT_3543876 [Mycena olivaceomarginata]